MRQTELFPMLIDQELLDNYLYYQKSLKIARRHKLSYENIIKNCNRAIEESSIENWDDEIQRKRTLKEFTNFINDTKNRVSECETTIEICLETMTEYSELTQ